MDDTNDFDELYNEGIVDLRFHLRNYALANGLNHVDRFIREAELAVKVVFDGFGNDEDTQITAPADGTTINEALAPEWPHEPDDGHEHDFSAEYGLPDTGTDAVTVICLKCGVLSAQDGE